ncbi:MAG: ATP-binding cassette domain-containing protein [candidate division NC10 bacterium]|nr:ATP-binding cassette domain-containing protein [candidate division NC10 bacterium]
MAILTARGTTKRFGGLLAVHQLDLDVEDKSIHSIIGPNGAGKTTFFNCVTGFYRPEEGEILFQGMPIQGLTPDRVTQLGIARTYQNIRLFSNMTALENILVGQHPHLKSGWPGAVVGTPSTKHEERAAHQEALRLLLFVGLRGKGDFLAKNLPYGDQRRLEIARALASRPNLLLLDEPTAGMNPRETIEMMAFIRRLRDELGITILLIEHQMRVVMGISECITVLDYGEKIAEGPPITIQNDARVIEAYLGRGSAGRAPGTPIRPGEAGLPEDSSRAPRTMLEVKEVHTYYGHIHALKGVSLTVGEGEIVTLIGANGAGKSTTLNTISGLLRPRHGHVRLAGEDLGVYKPHEIAAKGVVMVPEGRRIFSQLTVMENLQAGAYARSDRDGFARDLQRVFTLLPRLAERRDQVGGTLSGGEQQMLAIGRALMASPRLLLLDEPSMGLAPILVEQIFKTVEDINRQGTTILLVEQNATMALSIAHRGYVLETGTITLKGSAVELREHPEVKRAYLGEGT